MKEDLREIENEVERVRINV